MNSSFSSASIQPIFIMADHRSGSTLLRYIIDTHPKICSPGELYLGELCKDLHRTLYFTLGQVSAQPGEAGREEAVLAEVRRIVTGLMTSYANAKGKQMWCEKSPINVRHIDLLRRVFPDAKFICLYRNCLDAVQSKLEMNRQGWWPELVNFLLKDPQNLVSGMVESWIFAAKEIMRLEKEAPSNCFRVRYEDVVLKTVETLEPMFNFLCVEWDETLPDSIFSTQHENGIGDVKLRYAKRIVNNSIGKGSSIRRSSIPDEMLEKMNGLLEQLGYPQVGPDWDTAPSPYADVSLGAEPPETAPGVSEIFTKHFPQRLKELNGNLQGLNWNCKIIVPENGTWMIDPGKTGAQIKSEDRKADCTFTISAGDLLDIVNGRHNAIDLYLQGKINIRGNIMLATRISTILFAS